MKLATALALAALSPVVFAQVGPRPQGQGGPGGPGGPPSSGMGRSGGSASSSARSNGAGETETLRILSMKAVQTDLSLTASEASALSDAARTLRSGATTEDAALAVVSKVLTAAQAARLKELLVQDLGYSSLALSDVRARLSLTDDQTAQIAGLVSTLETAKAALATSTDVAAAAKAGSALMVKTSAELAKVLTADQDAKLRALAGRALGAE